MPHEKIADEKIADKNFSCQLKRLLSAYLLVLSWSGWITSAAIISRFSIYVEMFKKVMATFFVALVSTGFLKILSGSFASKMKIIHLKYFFNTSSVN